MTYFEHQFQVQFHELDPAGIMFFARLFNHAHDAYAALMAEAGMSLKSILEAGAYRLPLVHAEADYHHPLLLEDNIRVRVQSTTIGNSSFSFEYAFLKQDLCCATLNTSHVFLLESTNASTSIPDSLKRRLRNYSN